MKPIIGIISRVEYPGETHKLVFEEEYRKTIIKYGGIPLGILPSQNVDYTVLKYSNQEDLTIEEKEMIIKQLNLCDGFLMPGGFKMNKFDRFILEYIVKIDKPVLGICLGMQIMSNYKKEIVWNERNDSFIEHNVEKGLVHSVTLDKNSKLYSIVKNDNFMVTSRHSYHALPNDYFNVVALSDDNYIEAIEMNDKKFVIGVQWHPESMDDETSRLLFESFINACK